MFAYLDLEDSLHLEALDWLLKLDEELLPQRRIGWVKLGKDAELEVVRWAAAERSVHVRLRVLGLALFRRKKKMVRGGGWERGPGRKYTEDNDCPVRLVSASEEAPWDLEVYADEILL